jgi:hypothetical protein
MGIFSRRPRRSGGATDRPQIGDPRFEDWEVVREFEDLPSAQAWRRHLDGAGIEAVITADHELDRFGRGDLYLQVPPGRWSEAEEFLSNLDLD